MPDIFNYGTGSLSVDIAVKLASGKISGKISDEARQSIIRSQQAVEEIVRDNQTVYGITTGFGILSNTKISEEDTRLLQHKILQSHSVGVGNPIPPELAKLMMITKVHALARGYSGVQLSTLERICWLIDHDVIPIVPEKGSVGASGDLAPLAHLFLPLVGLGEVTYKDKRLSASMLLRLMEPSLYSRLRLSHYNFCTTAWRQLILSGP
jgi:histidine ammonia-lyase